MAEISKSKSIDSNKAALGRKLLNKHQKNKIARSNNNNKPCKDNNEHPVDVNTSISNIATNFINAEPTSIITNIVTSTSQPNQPDIQSVPIREYFNNCNTNNFFDFDRVAIDDPELKHNETFQLQHSSEHNEIIKPQQEIAETSRELLSGTAVLLDFTETIPNIIERSPSESPSNSDGLPYLIYSPGKIDLKQQLGFDSLQSQLHQQILSNSQLLGENSQLQRELRHSHTIVTQHTQKITELKQRIESSNARLAESQRQLNVQCCLADEWRSKVDDEERALNTIRKERDVALQDTSEILERLKVTQEDGDKIGDVIAQLRGQLDMANIRVQQLTTTNESEYVGINAQREEGFLQEKQLADIQAALKAAHNERDLSAQQYQLYNNQLSEQVTTLQAEVLTLRNSTEQLMGRERDLVAHIGDMERLLQSRNNCQHHMDKSVLAQSEAQEKLLNVDFKDSDELENVRLQCNKLTERLQETCLERDEALKELQALHGQAEELREIQNSQQADNLSHSKLLEEICSDKVALSRVIEQNLGLKSQVAEIEVAYLTLTQEKVAPLTDQLATAKHQVQGFEKSLRILQDAVEMKDRELEQMRRFETQVDQLKDRLRHYEAVHDHTTPSLQQQLQHLKLDNDKLRKQLHTQNHNQHDCHHDEYGDPDNAHHKNDEESSCGHHHKHKNFNVSDADVEIVVANADREDELQQQIFQLKQQLDELKKVNAELVIMQKEESATQENDTTTGSVEANADENVVTRLSRATAAHQLERKFTTTMTELASLNDEKQRLEHLVLQLQSETETIGEYVALYQRQRSLLAQRTAARENQLHQLQERLNDLAKALTEKDSHQKQRVSDLLEEIRQNNVGNLMLEQHAQVHQQHVGEVMDGTVAACGGGCAWCQGKLITV